MKKKKGKTLFYNEVSVKLFFTMSLVPVTCNNIASSHFYSMSFGRLESVKKQACTLLYTLILIVDVCYLFSLLDFGLGW